MKKEYRYFNHCYKHYTGKLYDWDEQGSPEDQDAYTRGMYHGFMMGQYAVKQLQREIRDLKEALSET